MIEGLKRLFDKEAAPPAEERERALRLATAALFFEVVRADGTVADDELAAMRAAIQSTFDIALYEFTQVVDQGLGDEDKKRIVELLWLLAFADRRKDPLEEHLVRTAAGLLHVSHPDFIDAKLRARSRT
jgi:uncharacterized tellurite resistance protein B-like protein